MHTCLFRTKENIIQIRNDVSNMAHTFGSNWTRDKLDRVKDYLAHYKIALKNQPFTLAYIDAFAGTGYINPKENKVSDFSFSEFIEVEEEVKDFIDGSARIALQIDDPFDKYIFIEKNENRFAELQKLKEEFPALAERIVLENQEANDYIQRLCQKDWLKTNRRAVMFLDPYGMQVKWQTIEAVAQTKAIDLWLLFPLGVAVNRLLKKNGEIKLAEKRRIDDMFGTTDWFDAFFQEKTQQGLFEEKTAFEKKANLDAIAEYFNNRLKSIFAMVAENPLRLYNSRNNPLYLLCFAAGNPKGAPIAVKIAQHILRSR